MPAEPTVEREWLPIKQYPMTGPVLRVEVQMADGRTYPDAHYAYGDGDGLMPRFDGWFIPSGRWSFVGIDTPTHWRAATATLTETTDAR